MTPTDHNWATSTAATSSSPCSAGLEYHPSSRSSLSTRQHPRHAFATRDSGLRPTQLMACLMLAVVAPLCAAPGLADGATRGGFLTIQFGRTQLGMATTGCQRLQNSVPLGRIARRMHRMGLAATGAVVVEFTSSTRRSTCRGMIRYPGWQRLRQLHDRYGWNFVSAGMRYVDPRKLSTADQQRDICGSLAAFRSHGLKRAWGLFAYPDDQSNPAVQSQVTARCFAYGRTYDHRVNQRATMGAPWFQRTFSVDGGACNLRRLACYRLVTPVWPAHYMSPDMLGGLMSPPAGTWRDVQFYRFVRRTHFTGTVRWDCRGSDWRRHWTTRIEVYCAKDLFHALREVPDRVRVADPVAVAQAWGRIPRRPPVK
jgi:hypothetical protein